MAKCVLQARRIRHSDAGNRLVRSQFRQNLKSPFATEAKRGLLMLLACSWNGNRIGINPPAKVFAGVHGTGVRTTWAMNKVPL